MYCEETEDSLRTREDLKKWWVQVYRTEDLKTVRELFDEWLKTQVTILYCLQFIAPCGSIFSNESVALLWSWVDGGVEAKLLF